MSTQQPILTARNLVKRYGRVTALDNSDFDLYPGEVLAVIGDNGAGKSTLIKAISGAVAPDAGEIRLAGEVVNFTSPMQAQRRRHRNGLPDACAVAGPVDREQHVPRPGDPEEGHSGLVVPDARQPGDGTIRAGEALGPRTDDHPEHRPGGGDALGRTAPGCRGGTRRGVRGQGDHHGRADCSARRQGVRSRARSHPRCQDGAACRSCSSRTTCRMCSRWRTGSTFTGLAGGSPSSTRSRYRPPTPSRS